MTPRDFVRKWKAATLKERSAAQEHLLGLWEWVGHGRCLGRWASLVLAGVLSASAAHPCACETPALSEALASADAVFVGKVVVLEVAEEKEFFDEIRITVSTLKVVKGEVASTTVFYADNFCCGSCNSNPFEIAKTYLIFAQSLGKDYSSGACSRTAEVALAAEDLQALGIDPTQLAK